ncbi:UMP kinase [Halovenus rubra]|uniref:UMP kinase n=2 Tax=Halovenus rubra TaxID=869890 RepID=A0ACC7E2H6_9EURY|nr:UMP kinase [Halovenus rubra]
MKVIVSIGGSVLAPEVGSERVGAYADAIESLSDAGHELGIVVGGGPTAREYIGAARDLGADEMELDNLGIAVTRLNARLLIAALDNRAAPTPPTDHETALEAFRHDDIPVMGGTVAGHTTDAVATGLAEYVDADLLVYATSVPGVFDADPNEDPEATKYDSLSASELLDVVSGIDLDAGSNAPVDLLATKLLERSGLAAVVIDGSDPEGLASAIDGDHSGTDIVPDSTEHR